MYIHPDHVVYKDWGKKIVILDVNTSEYFSLTETAAALWRLLMAGKSTGEAVDCLFAEYDVPKATLVGEMRSLVDELCAQNLLGER